MEKYLRDSNIYDVARKAGVSKSTVSRVLNDSKQVREETRVRVEQAVRELAYNPNSAARRLAGSADKRIGVILPFFSEMFSSFYIHEILQGIGEAVSERDAELLLHIQHGPQQPNGLDRILRYNDGPGAWIIADETIADDWLVRLRNSTGSPFILLNRSTMIPGVSSAAVDNRRGALLAVEHLIALGHRRIATIAGDLLQQPGQDRLQGYLTALEAASVGSRAEYIRACNFERQQAKQATHEMLALPEPPTAIFAASDMMAAGAREALIERGMGIPRDCSLVGFDDDLVASQMIPRLTTVRQPLREMARAAATWLLDLIDGHNGTTAHIALVPELVVRESTGPPGEEYRS